MKKLKILFISHTARTAGAEACLLTLVRCLDKEQFESVVVLPVDGALGEELREAGARTLVSPLEWWVRAPRTYGLLGSNISSRVQALVRILNAERPDVVHSNTSVIWEGALAAAFAGVPHVWHLHEILEGHPGLKSLFPRPVVYSLIDLLSDRVVTVSEAVRAKVPVLPGAAKMSVIHNGVQAPITATGTENELRLELGIPDDVVVAVSIGAVIPEKGYQTLIAAAELVRHRVAFVIVGRGEAGAVAELMAAVSSKGLDGFVHYLGYRGDVAGILAGADLLVLSSHSEAFSLVVVEAMAAGKPVVATDCGGPREMVAEGATGFLVPVEDATALAAGITRLAADAELRQKMGGAGRERYAELFTEKVFTRRFSKLYRDLSQGGQRPALEPEQRIFLEGMMATYQRIAENALARGAAQELLDLCKKVAALPLRPLQWVLDRSKKGRR